MSTWMRVLVLMLLAGCVPGDQDPPPAPEVSQSAPSTATDTGQPERIVDTDAYEAVRNVYRGVARNVPDEVCGRFTPTAAKQFAGHYEAESCTTVVILLYHGLVEDPETYANTSLGYFTSNDTDTAAEIDSCEFEVQGGPRLGVFVLERGESDGWIITAHRMEPC